MPTYNNVVTFGSGKLLLRDPAGNAYQVGLLEDVSVNFEGSTKSIMGGNQWPVVTVMTGKKISGKATFKQIDGRLIQAVMSGTSTVGRIVMNEVVGTGSSVTVSPTGTAFDRDFGVLDAGGRPMSVTASAPAVGAYSRSGSTYTFNASEPDSKTVAYTYTTGSGNTLSGVNAAQGTQSTFSMFLQEKDPTDGDVIGFELPSVIVPNLNFSFKAEDFGSQELNFEAQAPAGSAPFKVYTP